MSSKWYYTLVICALGAALPTRSVSAQEICDAGAVQELISEYATDAECTADGGYVSPQTLVDEVATFCQAKVGPRCRGCFAERGAELLKSLRSLARLGVFETSLIASVRSSLQAERQECPRPTPRPEPTPGDGEDGGGDEIGGAVLNSIRITCCPKPEGEFGECRTHIVNYGREHGLSEQLASSISAVSRAQLCSSH